MLVLPERLSATIRTLVSGFSSTDPASAIPEERWLTSADVKRELQISDSTLGRLKRTGVLVPQYFGQTPRYLESEVIRERTRRSTLDDDYDDTAVPATLPASAASAQPVSDSPDRVVLRWLRQINTIYAACGLVLLVLDAKFIQRNLWARDDAPLSSELIERLLIGGINCYLLWCTVWGALVPRKSNRVVLGLLGGMFRQGWMVFVLFLVLGRVLRTMAISDYELWSVLVISLFATGLGVFTLGVLKKWRARE